MEMESFRVKDRTIIKPFEEQKLKIYAYTLPEIPNHNGCIKVGETSRVVEDRIAEQTSTAGLTPNILFKRKAKKHTGEWFHDKDLHRYFILNEIERKDFGTGADEWFYFDGTPEKCEDLTDKFIANDYDAVEVADGNFDYILRDEQAKAVEKTLNYYKNPTAGKEFLWNAKPRFGKTLTTYDFIRKLHATNVLIVTNRPAIANSWWDDFKKFIAWQEPGLKFISDTDSLKGKVMTRADFTNFLSSKKTQEYDDIGCVAFVSLQDLKGAKAFGGNFDKLEWVAGLNWDLLVIDEAHEGVDTFKTDRAFRKIKTEFTLHLSGTPFKAIATNKFTEDQIYNWSYVDEQAAKMNWDTDKDTNPYENLPTLSLFTYQMSKMIQDKISHGTEISEDSNVDYAFDLNEFFKTKENGTTFIYEDSVKKFLDNLTERKFPFAESEYRHMLNHTFWLLPGVAPCKAMEKLLKKHDFFKDYTVVLAAGDGQSLSDDEIDENIEKVSDYAKANEKSFDKVRKAIAENNKTITLSCGQLTTGVTIPEWTAVFMLSNIKSPSLYFQAAFRSQNPYEFKDEKTGELYRKENAYIFDFAPERTLTLFDDFANNLSIEGANGTSLERQENIKELLNFFPVIAEDETGTMHEIDAGKVLTIPNRIKSKEVVKQGFMSNLLFTNIAAIFRAPAVMKEILDKIKPEKNKRLGDKKDITVTDPMIDDNGEVSVPEDIVINKTNDIFGDKIYNEHVSFTEIDEDIDNDKEAKDISRFIVKECDDQFEDFRKAFDLNKTQMGQIKNGAEKKLQKEISIALDDHKEAMQEAKTRYESEIESAKTEEEKTQKKVQLETVKAKIETKAKEEINKVAKEVVTEAVETEIVKQEEKKKKATEDEVRSHMRGFTRTIPAFIMAYGDRETTLSNFDIKVDEKTFEELTSITVDEFRTLRDGMIIEDEETGEEREVPGLFDEIVFNNSIQEFLDLKEKLSDYLNSDNKEDIFDYIPPQKTNQIFTPRKVVKMMVDMLEKENSEVFKNKDITFIDLYTKSGLYMTEIIKKLNAGLKDEIPDNKKRIKHIMEKQVYACAPSNIIYNMVKNYVYEGFDYVTNKNLMELDLSVPAEKGTLKEVLGKKRGESLKFDVIIGNPPYQESDGGAQASAKPIYQYFMQEAKKMNPHYIALITPSRWYVGGKGLDKYRNEMLSDVHLKEMNDWLSPADIFPNINIRGGVLYYLWDNSYDNSKNLIKVVTHKDNKIISDMKRPMKIQGIDIFIRDNIGVKIIQKIGDIKNLSEYVSARKPFGLATDFINSSEFKTSKSEVENPVICYARGWLKGYVDRTIITIRDKYIDKWKIFMSRANNIGTELHDDNLNSKIGEPGTICTESYLIVGQDLNLNKKNILSLDKYLRTKFLRYLHSLAKGSQDATAKTYRFVPVQDFTENSDIDWSKSIDEIDEQLFNKYDLSQEERGHIKASIKSMD